MSQDIRHAIEMEEHEALLWMRLKPEVAARADIRAQELREELAGLQKEEMAILLRFEEEAKPILRPESFLVPLTMDESIGPGRTIYDDVSHLRRYL